MGIWERRQFPQFQVFHWTDQRTLWVFYGYHFKTHKIQVFFDLLEFFTLPESQWCISFWEYKPWSYVIKFNLADISHLIRVCVCSALARCARPDRLSRVCTPCLRSEMIGSGFRLLATPTRMDCCSLPLWPPCSVTGNYTTQSKCLQCRPSARRRPSHWRKTLWNRVWPSEKCYRNMLGTIVMMRQRCSQEGTDSD